MTQLRRVENSTSESMEIRLTLLNQPAQYFAQFFGGRVPNLQERMVCIEQAVQSMTAARIFENNLYRVRLKHAPPFIQLSIRRLDGLPCKEWAHFQRIKNELVGPQYEAIELYPAESRLVDASHEYHLWVHADPNYQFPVGFQQRFVHQEPLGGRQTVAA